MSSRSKAEHWAQELEAVAGRIAPQFGRAEPRRRALTSLQGLLAPLERKNGWHLAEAAGDCSPHGMQEFLSRVHWDADALRDDLRAYVVEHLSSDSLVGQRMAVSLGVELSNRFVDSAVEVIRTV